MRKHYVCKLQMAGYRLNISVFTENPRLVEELALCKAIELFKQTFGTEKKLTDFEVVSVKCCE